MYQLAALRNRTLRRCSQKKEKLQHKITYFMRQDNQRYFATPIVLRKKEIHCDTLDTIGDNKDHKWLSEGSHPTYHIQILYANTCTCTLPPFPAICSRASPDTTEPNQTARKHKINEINKDAARGCYEDPNAHNILLTMARRSTLALQEEQRYCIACQGDWILLNHSSYDSYDSYDDFSKIPLDIHDILTFTYRNKRN